MNKNEVMKQLKAMGTAQNRKIYARHGVTGEMFGVSYANLGKLKKQIKVDHELGEQLWDTGNHDARVLAGMIMDPSRIKASTLDRWAKGMEDPVLATTFADVTSAHPTAVKRMEKWTKSRSEPVGTAGWSVLARLAQDDNDLSDAYLEDYLKTIEEKIHSSKNRVRYAMNSALIAIGIRNAKLEKKATAAAKRIGKVEVDHGETSCKTPEAVSYIRKGREHRKKKEEKAKARKRIKVGC